jgi:hypothetical protein
VRDFRLGNIGAGQPLGEPRRATLVVVSPVGVPRWGTPLEVLVREPPLGTHGGGPPGGNSGGGQPVVEPVWRPRCDNHGWDPRCWNPGGGHLVLDPQWPTTREVSPVGDHGGEPPVGNQGGGLSVGAPGGGPAVGDPRWRKRRFGIPDGGNLGGVGTSCGDRRWGTPVWAPCGENRNGGPPVQDSRWGTSCGGRPVEDPR